MPTVPQYEPGQVNEAPLQGVSIQPSENAAGDMNGEGVQKVLSDGVDILKKAKERADEVAVLDADTQLTKLETKLLHDPQTGALQKRGKDVLGVPEQVMGDYEKESANIASSLRGQTQIDLFNKMRTSRQVDIDQTLQRHVAGEIERYDAETTDSWIAASRDSAIKNWMTPQKVQSELQKQADVFTSFAKSHGKSDEFIAEKVKDLQSKTHSGVVEQMLANDKDAQAKQYFDANKDSFTADDQIALSKRVEEGSLRGESQRISDEVAAKYPGNLKAQIDHAIAATKDDPKRRDATVERIKDNANLKKAEQQYAQEGFVTRALNMLDKGKTMDDIQKLPGWTTLERSSRLGIAEYLQKKPADAKLAYEVEAEATTPALHKKFMERNLPELKAALGDKYDKFDNLQAKMRSDYNKGQSEAKGFMNASALVKDEIYMSGMLPDSKKGIDARDFIDARVAEETKRRGGKALGSEELRKLAKDALKEVTTNYHFLLPNSTKRIFELHPGDLKVENLDPEEKATIEKVFQEKNGKLPTDSQILQYYLQGQLNGS